MVKAIGNFALRSVGLYSRFAPTERGGYRLARLARSFMPRERWRGSFTTPDRLRLMLDLGTYPDCCMAVGLYELDTVRILRRLLKPGHHFVDVGANIGYFTMLAARLVGPTGRVDALEPDPINRQRFRDNICANKLEDRVRLHCVAASDHAGEITLYHPTANSSEANHGMATFYRALVPESQACIVPTARLDELIDRVPDLIKMDIEGAELQAIEGAVKLLAAPNPPALVIEHNPASCAAAGYKPSDLFKKLLEIQPKYRVQWIGLRLSSIATPEQLDAIPRQGNLLITP